jgi:glycosyltransferase involved in cell wall biosynthesis
VNLCTSHATLEILARRGIERLAYCPYGVDSERFHPRMRQASWRSRLSNRRADRFILLYVGRLAKEKTVEHLREAVRNREDVALAIVGAGPLRRQLTRVFRGTHTTFLGFLDGEELAHPYASVDAFIHPSQTETLGMVTLEAHAAGLPVIAADSPAARELIEDGINGLRFNPDRPGSLAEVVAGLIAEPDLLKTMRRRSRESVARATWTEATAVLRSHYQRARELRSAALSDGLPAPCGELTAPGSTAAQRSRTVPA